MSDQPDPQSGAGLLRVASIASALGVGGMTAAVYALRIGPDGAFVVMDAGVVVAFLVGALLGLGFWRLLMKWGLTRAADGKSDPRQRSRTVLFAVLVVLGGVALFLYPLRFVSRGKLIEILIGMVTAGLAVSVAAWLFFRVKRFLDEDTDQQSDKENDKKP